jgi:hypothetical protein
MTMGATTLGIRSIVEAGRYASGVPQRPVRALNTTWLLASRGVEG